MNDRLIRAIKRLPEKFWTAFVLTQLVGRSDAEAADALGVPLGTVKSRIYRARERLRKRVAR